MEAENKKDQTLEDVFEQLDEVVKKLEGEAVSLEDSFQLYHEGMELLKICNDKIETIEKKVMILDKEISAGQRRSPKRDHGGDGV